MFLLAAFVAILFPSKPYARWPRADLWLAGDGSLQARIEGIDKGAGLFQVDQIFWALGTTIKQAGSQENFRAVDFGRALIGAAKADMPGHRIIESRDIPRAGYP